MKERNVIVCTHTTWSYLCKHWRFAKTCPF
jgi:hypothetical protein